MKSDGRYAPSDISLDSSAVKIERRIMVIGELLRMLHRDRINFRSKVQRNNSLWNKSQQSRLIESILLNLPLPSFYFEYNDLSGDFFVVDGLQRLTALYDFVSGRLKLTGLDFLKEYEGKTWDCLSFYDRMRINSAEIVAYLIDGRASYDVKFVIFSRLNNEGVPLNPQEIRNGMFPDATERVLKPLADVPEFRSLGIRDNRMIDTEYVLRFLAFFITDYREYQGKMDYFLNETMSKIRHFSASEIDRLRSLFSQSIQTARLLVGEKVFRKPGNKKKSPMSKALFETLTVVIARNIDAISKIDVDSFRRDYTQLFSSPDFQKSLSTNTSDRHAVIVRFEKTEQVFQNLIKKNDHTV